MSLVPASLPCVLVTVLNRSAPLLQARVFAPMTARHSLLSDGFGLHRLLTAFSTFQPLKLTIALPPLRISLLVTFHSSTSHYIRRLSSWRQSDHFFVAITSKSSSRQQRLSALVRQIVAQNMIVEVDRSSQSSTLSEKIWRARSGMVEPYTR